MGVTGVTGVTCAICVTCVTCGALGSNAATIRIRPRWYHGPRVYLRAATLEADLAAELVKHVDDLVQLEFAILVDVPSCQQVAREALHAHAAADAARAEEPQEGEPEDDPDHIVGATRVPPLKPVAHVVVDPPAVVLGGVGRVGAVRFNLLSTCGGRGDAAVVVVADAATHLAATHSELTRVPAGPSVASVP